MLRNHNKSIRKFALATLATGAVLLATGCSTLQSTTQGLVAKASGALDTAKTAGADKYAPEIMKSANKNITLAKTALGKSRYLDAQKYAEKGTADSVRAGVQSTKNERSNEISSLREQIAKLMP